MDVSQVNREEDSVRGVMIQRAIESHLRDRVETWTRFDSRDLSIEEVKVGTLELVSLGSFEISLEPKFTRRPGKGIHGKRFTSHYDQVVHASADIAQLTEKLPATLQRWEEGNRSELTPELSGSILVAAGEPGFENLDCEVCRTSGKITCPACAGEGKRACHQCTYGNMRCEQCNGSGSRQVSCAACHGSGRRYESVTYQAWDHVRGQYVTDSRTESVACSACFGIPQRSESCYTCGCTGRVQCTNCRATGKVDCGQCQTSGKVPCESCIGLGFFHEQYVPNAVIDKVWSLDPVDPDQDSASAFALVSNDVSEFAASWEAGEARFTGSGIVIKRRIVVPFAKAKVGINDDFRSIMAVGPQYRLEELDGLGDLLLDDDVGALERAADAAGQDSREILEKMFRSEVNGHAADLLTTPLSSGLPTPGAKEALVSKTKGFLTLAHIDRVIRATSPIVGARLRSAHMRGLAAAISIGVLTLAIALIAPSWATPAIVGLLPLVGASLALVATEVFLRFGSDLSLSYMEGRKLIALRRAYKLEKVWIFCYFFLALVIGILCFKVVSGAGVESREGVGQTSYGVPAPSLSPTQDIGTGFIVNSTREVASPNSCKPSFDCSGRLNPVEEMVCNDQTLCRLDTELSQSYARARTQINSAGRRQLQQHQRTWLKTSRNPCSDRECIEDSYRQRIAELKQ